MGRLSDHRRQPRRGPRQGVASYHEARDRAARNGYRLRFDEETWAQMIEAGVAPQTVPDEVTLV